MDTVDCEILQLHYIGEDQWSHPVYRDQYENLWKDTSLGYSETPTLCDVPGNHIEGDPGHSIKQKYEILTPFRRSHKEREYLFLSRYSMDCQSHMSACRDGFGRLLSEERQKTIIEDMKQIYLGFTQKEKPIWLTWEEILQFESELKKGLEIAK